MTNLAEYGLDGINCTLCNNTGMLSRFDDAGIWYSRECSCMEKRRAIRRLKQSGLLNLMERYTFDNFQTPDEFTALLKDAAMKYCSSPNRWLYISGRPGSGKTHLCTAICGAMLENGQALSYAVWPETAGRIKSLKTKDPPPPEYEKELHLMKTVKVLYIDDFFKGKPTTADVKLAFEVINARYNNTDLRTIISSELTIDQLAGIDRTTAGRIAERSLKLRTPDRDWRRRR